MPLSTQFKFLPLQSLQGVRKLLKFKQQNWLAAGPSGTSCTGGYTPQLAQGGVCAQVTAEWLAWRLLGGSSPMEALKPEGKSPGSRDLMGRSIVEAASAGQIKFMSEASLSPPNSARDWLGHRERFLQAFGLAVDSGGGSGTLFQDDGRPMSKDVLKLEVRVVRWLNQVSPGEGIFISNQIGEAAHATGMCCVQAGEVEYFDPNVGAYAMDWDESVVKGFLLSYRALLKEFYGISYDKSVLFAVAAP